MVGEGQGAILEDWRVIAGTKAWGLNDKSVRNFCLCMCKLPGLVLCEQQLEACCRRSIRGAGGKSRRSGGDRELNGEGLQGVFWSFLAVGPVERDAVKERVGATLSPAFRGGAPFA